MSESPVAANSPVFARPRVLAVKPRGRWAWGIVPVLALALLLQFAVADRARLAADRDWRPRIAALCELLRCTLPPWREPAALHLTSRDLRPHPTLPGVLVVSASFRNDAPFAQPWPQLQLSLQNLDGESLGLRRFAPREYLGAAPATTRIGAGQSASIRLEILDPGKRAVAFGFEFH
ncbi:MAG: DUF3426 domain-containing protein [Arenimonas sp.]